MTHEELCEAATKAINAVFSDRSVSQRDTLHSLRDLRDEIGMLTNMLETDLRDEAKRAETDE